VAINKQLENTLEEAIIAMGYEWVGCEWAKDNGCAILRIYIDTVTGVVLDQCAKASRELSAILDVEDFSPNAYRLEVSSPGIERPLFKTAHYASQIGKRVSLKLRVPDQTGRSRFKGVIESVDGLTIRVLVDESDQILELVCSQVEKARLLVNI
jgi:ribosome maturation factor RimP